MQYTYKERTEKKYTVGQAVTAAGNILKTKHVRGVCMNAIRRYSMSDTLTLVEYSNLIEQIVDDSFFYS